jgi:hypothetical protein
MRCAGCNRRLEVGDRYIAATASEFMGKPDDGLNDLMAELMGGAGGKVAYCEPCTQDSSRGWDLQTFYGEGLVDG